MRVDRLAWLRDQVLGKMMRSRKRHQVWFIAGWATKAVSAGFIGWAFGNEWILGAFAGLLPFLLGTGIDECARWKAARESPFQPSGWRLVRLNTFDQTLQMFLATLSFLLTFAVSWLSFAGTIVTYLLIVGICAAVMWRLHPTAKQIRGEDPEAQQWR